MAGVDKCDMKTEQKKVDKANCNCKDNKKVYKENGDQKDDKRTHEKEVAKEKGNDRYYMESDDNKLKREIGDVGECKRIGSMEDKVNGQVKEILVTEVNCK